MTNDDTRQDSWVQQTQQQFDTVLNASLPKSDTRLHQAMRYACLNGGKRLRPLLVYAAGMSFDATHTKLHPPAIAIELIHCYSLVHDDLPAMDDDNLRRGKPSCHKAFDEATAILVGDALQSLAFDIISREASCPNQLAIINMFAQASGSLGMAGGQSLDMLASNTTATLNELQHIHYLKTGALFTAAIRIGALASGNCNESQLTLLHEFSNHFGLAFQIRDDILDVEANASDLGKTAGKDASQHKATYPALLGLDESKMRLAHHIKQAQTLLDHLELAKINYLKFLLGFLTDCVRPITT